MIVAAIVHRNDPRSGVGDSRSWVVAPLTEVTGFSRDCLLELLPMPPPKPSPSALSWSLRAGAAYDAVFALLFVAFPGWISTTFRLPLPGERFYLWLIAVFLLSLAGFYFLVARDPGHHFEFVRLAIAIRLLGAAVIAAAAAGRPDLTGLYAIAAGDLAFGLAHLVCARAFAPLAPLTPLAPDAATPQPRSATP